MGIEIYSGDRLDDGLLAWEWKVLEMEHSGVTQVLDLPRWMVGPFNEVT